MNAPDRQDAFTLYTELGEQAITYLPDTKMPNAGTFSLLKQDHTIGNLLRLQLLRDSNVKFVGYIMPHPLINRLDLKVQSGGGMIRPINLLTSAIEDLANEAEFLENGFKTACEKFKLENE